MGFKKLYKGSSEGGGEWFGISDKEAYENLKKHYSNASGLLDDLRLSPGIVINLPFSVISYQSEEFGEDEKEILNRIYDTLFENVGMSKYHVKFLDDSVTDQEIGNVIRFKINGNNYVLRLERILDEY